MVEEINCSYLNASTIDKIMRLLPDDRTLKSITSFYSLFGDATRLRIISALSMKEMCVTDLATLLEANQSTLSHQLRLLEDNGILSSRRIGKMIFYYVDNILIDDVMSLGIENMQRKNRY